MKLLDRLKNWICRRLQSRINRQLAEKDAVITYLETKIIKLQQRLQAEQPLPPLTYLEPSVPEPPGPTVETEFWESHLVKPDDQ